MLRPDPGSAALGAFAEAAIARISEPYVVEGQAVSIGASIGIATAPGDAREADDLLRCADMALYGAKSAARGTWLHFVSDMDDRLQRRRQVEMELRTALASGQIEVFYQPTVDLRTGRVSTFEALVRWRHPVEGLVPPDRFIPIAEECGLIADLGEFVLRRACEDAMGWPADVRVAVNVSPKQFLLRRDLVDRVAGILGDTGLAPDRLEIEITESTLLDAKAALAALAKTGIRISLDDFGTGYSSLAYLRLFTIHKIKIDRSFVRIADRASLAIIEAVAALAATLDMDLVVEGVETQDQLRAMADRRIHLIQGYLFSRPRPLDELAPLLEGRLDAVAAVMRAVAGLRGGRRSVRPRQGEALGPVEAAGRVVPAEARPGEAPDLLHPVPSRDDGMHEHQVMGRRGSDHAAVLHQPLGPHEAELVGQEGIGAQAVDEVDVEAEARPFLAHKHAAGEAEFELRPGQEAPRPGDRQHRCLEDEIRQLLDEGGEAWSGLPRVGRRLAEVEGQELARPDPARRDVADHVAQDLHPLGPEIGPADGYNQ